MRVPLKWLSEYVDLNLSPEELARRLTTAGAEVGEIISTAGDWEGVTVAQVIDVVRHPKADRLVLATVDLGAGRKQTVVCGAPNVTSGQKVAFAPAGTKLIDGHTGKVSVLKPAVIRGVESAGMICSERELGISEDHQGILILDEGAPVGSPLSSYLGEVIFDLDLSPNRPDLLSMVGVAREAGALTGQDVREPSIETMQEGEPIAGQAKVRIEDRDLCPRYCAALIEDVKMGESPKWMKERLLAAGMRPINNVVDVTNYVMLELGQPLHAFDFSRVSNEQIVVRRARQGETLLLLDGTEQKLSPDMLVIADAERPLALAGVMGGLDSEVNLQTTTVLLESATFNPASIRRTRQSLKLRTDASDRFEKGISSQLPPIAAQRAVRLMEELCGGRAAKGLIDAYPVKQKDVRVTVTQDRLRTVLGVELTQAAVRNILGSLGFGCRWTPPDRFVVRVPYWRTDIFIADDVIEEIARITGYDKLPTTLLRGQLPPVWPQPRYTLRERVRDILTAGGLQETITYSLTSIETLAKVISPAELEAVRPLKLANPMSREAEYARTTLRASALQTLASNIRRQPGLIALFETSRVYLPRDSDLPEEVESLCGVVCGRHPDRWGQPGGDAAGFYDAKAYVKRLLDELRVDVRFEEDEVYAYLPGRTAAVIAGGDRIGVVGQVHPQVAAAFDIEAEVAMFELDLDALLPHASPIARYQPVPAFPPVQQDLAVIVPEDVSADRVLEIIRSFPLVRSVSIFDVYSGPPVPSGRKSLAFSVSFQAADHTLTDVEASRQRQRVLERLKRDLGAEIRG